MNIKMKLNDQSYDIALEPGILHKAGQHLVLERKVLIVTDDGVPASYPASIASQCSDPIIVTIPQGESSKSFTQLQDLLSEMLHASFTRHDCVVAVGGGVVGDVAGFAASCYMRGIDFYNIPTTLLSQLDSSIGGKTAINFEGVKNVVGAFYQPKKVLIDPDTLNTLITRQLFAGLAEAIKIAVTCDAGLFSLIESSENLSKELPEIIYQAVCIKRDIVEADPKEVGLRRVLNFGHTIGHAIESYQKGELLHGECIGLGMLPMCSEDVRMRLKKILQKYNLPTKCNTPAEQLLPYIIYDKKAQSGSIKIVYVSEIGSYEFHDMSVEEILRKYS